jgi:ubiquinone/menaquinone biosynthesis C-methylase UbiE
MDISLYRESQSEQERVRSLLRLISQKGQYALDVGARDGYLSVALTDYFEKVTALDLNKPSIDHAKVISVKGNITSLDFPGNHFDLVLCAEVLEHIPPKLLAKSCSEISRVAKETVIIGVPYKQDIRVGRTTCPKCGRTNPPWGHRNVFDEGKLKQLFPQLAYDKVLYVGKNYERTNFLSKTLLDFAGNPYGTYDQEEECIHCKSKITGPMERDLLQKIDIKIAYILNIIQSVFIRPQPNWIHVRFKKK